MSRTFAVFHYHDTEIRAERLTLDRDHCAVEGPIYDIAELVQDGVVIDPELGIRLTTTERRRLIYAVDGALHCHLGFDGERGESGAVKHETLFHNGPVAAAGEIEFVDGVVTGINDRSGTYRTTGLMRVDRRLARAVLAAFRGAGVPMDDSTVDYLTERAS
jgi:hypothetical protein